MNTDTIWMIGVIVLVCLYGLKRLYNYLLGDEPVCGDLYYINSVRCTLSMDHYGDHRYHDPGTGMGDDKTWTWPRREHVPALLPSDGEVASYLCARTAHQIAEAIARDSAGMQKYKDVSKEFVWGMDYAQQLAEKVAREWENR